MKAPSRLLSVPSKVSSQRRAVALPPGLQVLQENDEVRVAPDAIEIWISREVGIAGPAAVGGLSQPVNRTGRLAEQGIYRGDVVSGVMKMDEALALHHGVPDVLLGPPGVALLGEQDGPGARDHATAVLRMRPQVARHERRRFFVPAEVEESPGNLIVPEGLVGLGWHLADQAQAIFISSLVHEGEADASRRAVVADRKSTRLNSSHSQISYAVFCL